MRELALDALLALVLALGSFALLGGIGFELTDEGYLWYGVQRAALGEVPFRDFQAYDPGRYYWCVAWARLFGTGLLGMRLSLALYQAIGLFFALRVARRAVETNRSGIPFALIGLAVLLTMWVFPRHKVFEHTAVVVTVWVIMRWLEQRDARRALAAGLWTGFAFFMGRNHALYAGLTSVAVLGWVGFRESLVVLRTSLLAYSFGVGLGLLPTLGMLAFVPGFAESSWELVRGVLDHGSNLGLPLPWPWTIDFASEEPGWSIQLLGTGLTYILLCVVYPLGLVAVVRTPAESMPRRAAFAASILVGVVWAHHAAVRAEAGHLAQAAHPLWLALFTAPAALGGAKRRWLAIASGTLLVTLTAMVPPFADARWTGLVSPAWVPLGVGDDEVRAREPLVRYVEFVEGLVEENVPASEPILIAPFEPGFYPFLGRKAPIIDTYQIWPSSEDSQRRAIAALDRENVRWAFIGTTVIDQRPETGYSRTNPLVLDYLERNFERVPDVPQLRGRVFLKRRSTPPAPSPMGSSAD